MSENQIRYPDESKTPESQAAQNTAIAAAVREAVTSVFAGLLPALKDMAITPEKLREANKPWVDEKLLARNIRESQNSREQLEQMRKELEQRQAVCQHRDKNGNDAISIVHNFPDRQPRGVCMLQHCWIHPREWVIDAPDPVTGKSKARIRDAHKDYARVQQIEAMSG